MKKIYLVIAGAFLIILVITSMLLSFQKKTTTSTQNNSPFPTGLPDRGTNGQSVNDVPANSFEPIETLDFKAEYVPSLKKIVVEKKTPQAEEIFNQWVDQNQLNTVINDFSGKKNILFTNEKIIPTPSDSIHKLETKVKDFFQLMDDLNSIGKGSDNNQLPAANNPTPVSNKQSPNPSLSQSHTTNLSYYAQSGDQGDLPLPNGCTLSYAGCGATTVAMITSSYLNKSYDPKAIVDIYKSKKYYLGCNGSSYLDAHELLSNLGLKTTDYLTFNMEKADTVVPQLRKSIDAGWTFFALARFCDDPKKNYCGHIFWITDIDAKGNIWAYDPAYGRYQIPYNENSRYPYPLYRLAFGVKK